MKTTPIKLEAGIAGQLPQFKMNQTHVSNLVRLLLGAFIAATSVHAQRESFEASRIVKSTELALQMKAPSAANSPGKPLTRKGADSRGQPVAVQATSQMVSFDNIFFELDSIQIRNRDSELQLLEIVSFLKLPAFAKTRFLIEGHTCDLGKGSHNLRLSAARAEAVCNFLISQGIAPERLAVIGLGETEPDYRITSQDGAGSIELKRSHNRRVVLRALPPRPSRD